MEQNAAEGKEEVRSVNAEKACSQTELLIVGNNIECVHCHTMKYKIKNHAVDQVKKL